MYSLPFFKVNFKNITLCICTFFLSILIKYSHSKMNYIKKVLSNQQIINWSQLGSKSKHKKKLVNGLKKFLSIISGFYLECILSIYLYSIIHRA
jgi:hypothetical protein